jgi:hypothetical protein
MPTKKRRAFHALVRVKGYKYPFELSFMSVRGGLADAREVAQEQFSSQVDEKRYPRLPRNHTPRRRDIRIVWA